MVARLGVLHWQLTLAVRRAAPAVVRRLRSAASSRSQVSASATGPASASTKSAVPAVPHWVRMP